MSQIFERLLTAGLFSVLLVFARLGSAMVSMPAFGEQMVPVRARLLLAVAITIVVAPIVGPSLPGLPPGPLQLALLVGGEVIVGLFIGLVMRIFESALNTAGLLIAQQIGLAAASIFNPLLQVQGSGISFLLTTATILLLFETDLHHVVLQSVIDSYRVFPPGNLPAVGDFSETMVRVVSRSFALGIELSGPTLILTTLVNFVAAILSRLLPQFQVFFLVLPIQVGVGFILFGALLSTILGLFLTDFSDFINGLFRSG